MLVRVVAFLASKVVLFPVVSLHVGWALKLSCLPLSLVVSLCVGWVLVGVVAFLASEMACLRLSHVGMGVGSCGSLLGL